MWCLLPKEIVNIIIQYDGRIKYRKGKYMNQLNIADKKYDLLNKFFINKTYIFNKILFVNGDTFYIYFPVGNYYFGMIYDYKYHGTGYTISFYKDIQESWWYKMTHIFYKLLNKHHKYYFITKHEYE